MARFPHPLTGFAASGFRRSPRRAFTLIEMLIVAALISLFSAIAVISVQTQLENNRRKAIIGESRQIATSMDLAHNDVGFFPSVAFLDRTSTSLDLESERIFAGNVDFLYGFLHPYALDTAPAVGASNRTSTISRIRRDWTGQYISATQTRSSVSSGRGGSRSMTVFPTRPAVNWPLDGLNNPWMFYSLHVDRTNPNSPVLFFVTQSAADRTVANDSGLVEGNFINAVVSYGRNNVPGGGDQYIPTGDINGTASNTPYGLRLYSGNPNNTGATLTLYVTNALRGDDGLRRANAWGRQFYQNAGFNVAEMALNNNNSASVGITDPESDDIVFGF
ncbi:MAG: type II secretion system protein [Candidatus Sumerlaeia bacterium]|nr:type II secretion system protein [Candidatus Sumerlaeia bacterium]